MLFHSQLRHVLHAHSLMPFFFCTAFCLLIFWRGSVASVALARNGRSPVCFFMLVH